MTFAGASARNLTAAQPLRQLDELLGGEPLGAHVGRQTHRGKRLAGVLADPGWGSGREGQRPGEGLAPVRKGVMDERPHRRGGPQATPAGETEEHGVDVRHRPEDTATDRAQDLDVALELRQYRRDPVGAAAGLRGEPLPHLALDHHDPASDRRQLGDRAQDDGRGDAVGQIRDHLRGRGLERSEVDGQRVADLQLPVGVGGEHRPQVGFERGVKLDHVDEPNPLRKALGEDAETASDLEHDVLVGQRREPLDHVEDVAIDQEILA